MEGGVFFRNYIELRVVELSGSLYIGYEVFLQGWSYLL